MPIIFLFFLKNIYEVEEQDRDDMNLPHHVSMIMWPWRNNGCLWIRETVPQQWTQYAEDATVFLYGGWCHLRRRSLFLTIFSDLEEFQFTELKFNKHGKAGEWYIVLRFWLFGQAIYSKMKAKHLQSSQFRHDTQKSLLLRSKIMTMLRLLTGKERIRHEQRLQKTSICVRWNSYFVDIVSPKLIS